MKSGPARANEESVLPDASIRVDIRGCIIGIGQEKSAADS